MRLRRAFLAGFTAWLAVVLVGATMVWAVISRAGQELVAGETPGTSATSPATQHVEGGSTIHHRPRPTKGPAGDDPSGVPSAEPSDTATEDPSSPGSGSTGGKPDAPGPTVRTGTWAGAPGRVTVSCRGALLLPNYVVSPNNGAGWRPDDTEKSPGRLEVQFKKEQSGEDEAEYELTASCVEGVPRFSGQADDD